MEYKISEVKLFSEQTYGRDNNHRALVKLEGQEKEYSAFVKDKPSVGDVWEGELAKTEKDDKIYWNFKFSSTKRDSSPAARDAGLLELKNILMLRILPMLQSISDRLPIEESDYPKYKEGVNDAKL